MRARLDDAIEVLARRVIEADEQAQLGALREQLAAADDDRVLNQVRDALVAGFNGYADGKPLFGPRIGPTAAAAGTYRLTLTVGGGSYEAALRVREDPLTTEHGGRD